MRSTTAGGADLAILTSTSNVRVMILRYRNPGPSTQDRKKKDVASGGRWACFLGGEAPTDGGDVGASSRGNPRRSAGATRPAVRDTQSGSDSNFSGTTGHPGAGVCATPGCPFITELRNYRTIELRNYRTELLSYRNYALRMVQPNIMLWSSCARLWQWAT